MICVPVGDFADQGEKVKHFIDQFVDKPLGLREASRVRVLVTNAEEQGRFINLSNKLLLDADLAAQECKSERPDSRGARRSHGPQGSLTAVSDGHGRETFFLVHKSPK